MVRNISKTLGAPLHHQIQAVIRDGIATGRYGVGDMLPTESTFCGMFSVSRITVRKAMGALEHDGLIARQRGRGTFVLPRQADPSPSDESASFLRHLSAVVATTTSLVIDFGLVAAPPDIRKALALPGSDLSLRIVRIRQRKSRPILHTTLYVDQKLIGRVTREDFEAASAAAIMIRCGYVYRQVSYSAGAALADSMLASELAVPIGSPLLDLRRVSFDHNNRPFEYLKLLGPPDRFRFEVTMEQNANGDLILESGP